MKPRKGERESMQPVQNEIEVRVRFLRDGGCPYAQGDGDYDLNHATAASAGVDLKACLADQPGQAITIEPGGRFPVPTGIAIEIGMPGVAGFVFSRSGLGTKKGLTVSQGVGVIDPDYRGEIIVSLLNTSGESRTISHGDRIAQLLFLPYFAARIVPSETLSDTDRGAGGFGHTGA